MDNYNWFANRADNTRSEKSATFINNTRHWPSAHILNHAKSDLANPTNQKTRSTNQKSESPTSLIAKSLL